MVSFCLGIVLEDFIDLVLDGGDVGFERMDEIGNAGDLVIFLELDA